MVMSLTLSAVGADRLEAFETLLFELLGQIAAQRLDLANMQDCINSRSRMIMLKCENAEHHFPYLIVEDDLYGRRDGEDLKRLASTKGLDILRAWTDTQWKDLMSKWLSDAHHVSILGVPSKEVSDKITSEKNARIRHNVRHLSREG